VNVRVIPIQTRRLTERNSKPVFERGIAGLNRGPQHLILMHSGGTVRP